MATSGPFFFQTASSVPVSQLASCLVWSVDSAMNGKFSPNTSDVKVRSSDGVEFDLHKTLLEAYTGAFPGPELDTQGEAIELTESGDVLELLFAFVYPKRQPDLEDENFELVAALAEAVGKYEVYSAINTCNARLKSFLPERKIEIFTYALKHGHPKLADDACPYLVRTPLIPVLKELPAQYFLPWTEYHEKWSSIFSKARKTIKNLPSVSQLNLCHTENAVCNTCRSSLYTWIANVEEHDSIPALQKALSAACLWSTSLPCCKAPARVDDRQSFFPIPAPKPPPKCDHVVVLAKACLERLESIPAFSNFVRGDL